MRSVYVFHAIKYGWPCPMDNVGPMSDIGLMANPLKVGDSKLAYPCATRYMYADFTRFCGTPPLKATMGGPHTCLDTVMVFDIVCNE